MSSEDRQFSRWTDGDEDQEHKQEQEPYTETWDAYDERQQRQQAEAAKPDQAGATVVHLRAKEGLPDAYPRVGDCGQALGYEDPEHPGRTTLHIIQTLWRIEGLADGVDLWDNGHGWPYALCGECWPKMAAAIGRTASIANLWEKR